MVVNDFPTIRLSPVDVGGTPLPAERLSSNLALKSLGTDGVRDIVTERNHHYIFG